MEKTAKITRTVFKNDWISSKGVQIFYHDIELDNGDKGSIGTKEKQPSKLNPGQELIYTIDGGKIKAVSPQNGGAFAGGKKMPANNASFALAYAKDILIASWNNQQFSTEIPKLKTSDMFELAEKMNVWMETKKS